MSEVLARYTFLPWMRRGLSAKIEEAENFNDFNSPPPDGWMVERPEIDIRVNIEAKKGDTTFNDHVEQNISLVGPGDITSVDQRIVIKTEPRNWVTNFEPNYFPYIEFYDEDFPWRYSPASSSGNKLRPWMVLVALKESEFKRDTALFGSLPSILVTGSEDDPSGTTGAASSIFPDPGQNWAWSHVHMNGDVDPTNNLDPTNPSQLESALNRFRELLAANPDQAVARMICPRVLDPNTTYHCFLLPAYETGRLAGLGAKADLIGVHEAQKASFGADHPTDGDHQQYADHFPYYYEWQFTTGDVGDFESLVRKLVPREVDQRVGTREMDIQEPGFNIQYSGAPHNDGILMLEGALLPPGGTTTREAYPWPNSFSYRAKLANLLNLSEDLRKATFPPSQIYGTNPFGYSGAAEDIQDDPIITPDLYGRWHALKDTLDTSLGALSINDTWLYESNLDPRSRAVAGIGVQHIKKNQERLMDRAWGQLGEVIEANRKLKWGQFSKQIAFAAYKKHLTGQQAEQVNAIAAKLFKRVKIGSTTVFKQIKDSPIANATQSATYRRIERPGSPLMKRMDPGNMIFNNNNLRIALGTKTLSAVDTKVYSIMQGHIPLTLTNEEVNTVASYQVATARFATSEPGAGEFEVNIESEIRFQAAVQTYQHYFQAGNWKGVEEKPAFDLATTVGNVVDMINPRFVIPKRIYDRVRLPGYTIPPADKIVPVMAYPVFQEAMYETVNDLGVDYFIPNLELIPNNTVTLLESNQKFIEAFLLGANHEMGRELLWREFPTDQRGSYFRQFWDSVDAVNTAGKSAEDMATEALDIEEIHTWPSNTELGTHNARPGVPDTGMLVLVIRGDLLKKFPDTVIYAQEAKFKAGSNHATDPRELDVNKEYPVFSARIEPDIHFFGFNLTADQARGDRNTSKPGWFFIIQERPGEIRFGLDIAGDPSTPASWNDLNQSNAPIAGSHLDATNDGVTTSPVSGNKINNKSVKWGYNSTNLAQILYQNPVLLAVHGDEMIP